MFIPKHDYFVICDSLDQAVKAFKFARNLRNAGFSYTDGRKREIIFKNNKRLRFVTRKDLINILNTQNIFPTRLISEAYFSQKEKEFEEKENEYYEMERNFANA